MKLLEKNKHVDKANWPWSCNNFLEMTPKQLTKTKTKWDYIKLKKASIAKEMINKMNRQAVAWEKIFAKHISDKGLSIQNLHSLTLKKD